MNRLILIGLILLLTACGTPAESTPMPTLLAFNVIYPPTLQPWADRLAVCAADTALFALYFKPSAAQQPDILSNDVVLEWGQPTQARVDSHLFQVGFEQLVVVVNKENPLSQLSSDELSSIFSGQLTKWENLTSQPVQVWVFPEGEPTRTIFDQAVIPTRSAAPQAMLAPDSAAMLNAISSDVNSIGYLPASFVKTADSSLVGKVKIIQLDPTLEKQLDQPIIAITRNDPRGYQRQLLVCLQKSAP